MDYLSSNILNIIEKFSYKFFVVKQDFNVKCVCIKEGSNQPDPNCPKCLGTGYKIKIYKIKGASKDSGVPANMRNNTQLVVAKEFYITSSFELSNDDIIIDQDDEIYFVYQSQLFKGFEGKKVYRKYICVPKKLDTKVFMKNFKSLIGG